MNLSNSNWFLLLCLVFLLNACGSDSGGDSHPSFDMRGDWIVGESLPVTITSHNRDTGEFEGQGEGENFILYGNVKWSDTTLGSRKLAVVWMRIFIGGPIFCESTPNSSWNLGTTYQNTEAYYIYAAEEIVSATYAPYTAYRDTEARYRSGCNNGGGSFVGKLKTISFVKVTSPGDIDSDDSLYSTGDSGPAGGTIFYVSDDGLHGMEAARENLAVPVGAEWGCGSMHIDGTDGIAIGTGAQNTADILSGCMDTPIAADIAAGYSLNGYSDWFLPSKDELTEMRGVVNFDPSIGYWSSSQVDGNSAWMDFGLLSSSSQYISSKYSRYYVRAVRAF